MYFTELNRIDPIEQSITATIPKTIDNDDDIEKFQRISVCMYRDMLCIAKLIKTANEPHLIAPRAPLHRPKRPLNTPYSVLRRSLGGSPYIT